MGRGVAQAGAKKGTILFATCGALIGIVGYAMHGRAGIDFSSTKIPLSFLLFALLASALALLMKRSGRSSTVGSAVIMCVLLMGFLAWIPPLFNFGLRRMKMDVTLTPGEVQGLNRLGERAAPGERFATKKHEVDSLVTHRERSYGYAALSERPALLEGLQYHTPEELPWFKALVRDNDLIFSTTDPETVRDIAKNWLV